MTNEYLQWLRQLIENDEVDKFYHDKEWIRVTEQVKKMDHYECQQCKREGRMTLQGQLNNRGKPVQMSVHHKKEVKKYPELALSIFYVDETGKRKRNLEYICEPCHNKEHNKLQAKKQKKFINEEKW